MHAAVRSRRAAVTALAVLLAGCIGGERLSGPTVTVENDTGSALVVSAPYVQWSVPAHSTMSITSYTDAALQTRVIVAVFDAATCAVVGGQSLRFSDGNLDQTVVVSAGGAISSRPWVQSDHDHGGDAPVVPAPSRCHADASPQPPGS